MAHFHRVFGCSSVVLTTCGRQMPRPSETQYQEAEWCEAGLGRWPRLRL